MRELVFLLEERSSAALLESLLPRLLAPGIGYRLVPFEGKQDLERSLVRRVRGYQNRCSRFIILRDQDSHPDCTNLKRKLQELCNESGKGQHCLVRLACRELESFYLADLSAVAAALNQSKLASRQQSRKFRTPDNLQNPSRELELATNFCYQKVSGSREIGIHLELDNTRSPSFKNLIAGIRRLQVELLSLPEDPHCITPPA